MNPGVMFKEVGLDSTGVKLRFFQCLRRPDKRYKIYVFVQRGKARHR